MFKRLSAALALILFAVLGLASQALGAPPAKEPNIRQIYEAASAGKFKEADAMIAKVLKNHPKSAKAHFVHAQILTMEDKLDDARDALSRAREFAPGLPFAKPDAVAKLERQLEKPPEIVPPEPPPAPMPVTATAADDSGPAAGSASERFPWGPIVAVLFVGAIAYLVFRKVRVGGSPTHSRFSRANRSDSSMGWRDNDDDSDRDWDRRNEPAPANTGAAMAAGAAAGVAAGVAVVLANEVLQRALHDRSDDRGDTFNIFNNHGGNARMGSHLGPSSDSGSDYKPDSDFGIKDTSSWDSSSSSSDSGSSDSGSSSDSSSSSSDW